MKKKPIPTTRDSIFTLPDSKGKIHLPRRGAQGIALLIHDGKVLMQIPLDGAGHVKVLIPGQGAKDLGAQLIRLGLQLVGPTQPGGTL